MHHNSDMSELKDRLIEARTEKGYSQAKVAELAGIPNQSTIASLETGYRKSTTYLVQIAKVLDVEPMWLDKGIGPKKAQPKIYTISDELSAFLNIPKNLIDMEMVEQLQIFASQAEDLREKGLKHIEDLKSGETKKPRKDKEGN